MSLVDSLLPMLDEPARWGLAFMLYVGVGGLRVLAVQAERNEVAESRRAFGKPEPERIYGILWCAGLAVLVLAHQQQWIDGDGALVAVIVVLLAWAMGVAWRFVSGVARKSSNL